MMTDFKSYFSLADVVSQERMNDRYKKEKKRRILHNLKATLLFNEYAIIRGTSIIKSDLTEEILLENPILLEKGLVRPEIRHGGVKLQNQIDELTKNRKFRSKKLILKKNQTTEWLDSLDTKVMVDADQLSSDRSFGLAFHLLKLYHSGRAQKVLKPNLSYSDLDYVLDKLFNHGIPDRSIYLDDISKLFRRKKDAINLVQSVYFAMGANHTKSHPVWTSEINPAHQLDIWQMPIPRIHELNSNTRKIAQKYGISNFLENYDDEIHFADDLRAKSMNPEKIARSLELNIDMLDYLSWNDIIDIKGSPQLNLLRDHMTKFSHMENFDINLERLFWENKQFRKAKKKQQVFIDLASIVPILGWVVSGVSIVNAFRKNDTLDLKSNYPLLSYSSLIKKKIKK